LSQAFESITIEEGVHEITVDSYADYQKSDDTHFLLDVREPEEIAIAAFKGAVNIPLGKLPENINKIPSDVPVIILCHHGRRSLRACCILREFELMNSYSLRGGIDAWSIEIDSRVPRY